MPEPFKNVFNTDFILKLTTRIQSIYPEFEIESFRNSVFDAQWESRELKSRMRHISICLRQYLPQALDEAFNIVRHVSTDFSDVMEIAPMVFPDFVEHFGLDHPESIDLLEHLTRYSSSEFAIRPFIIKDQNKVMETMYQWAQSDNYHVRRCASEGTRPRLPWAMALPALKADPSPIIPILEQLKNDPELYVRRSVANNLNDIAKDHPDIVISLAQKWLGQSKHVDWVVKHGCRTLLKQGHPHVLTLFGFKSPKDISINLTGCSTKVLMGDTLNFSFDVHSQTKQPLGKLRLEFAIDFIKANGKQARKVFQISEGQVDKSTKMVTKFFSFKPITTRKYYAGEHNIAILVNGVEKANQVFHLIQEPA